MTQDLGLSLETLRPGAEFTLYRARRTSESSLLALAASARQPSAQSLARLAHEYAFGCELDSAWAARPLSLTEHDGRTLLLLEDDGAEPLDLVLAAGQLGLDLERRLLIASALARALGQMHRQGLVHKDVKPHNVLVDGAGHARLTGFGIASRLRRERQVLAPPEVIAGTFAYMAPEQTGRMNRSVDARSDLYSLGVTLYELFTGTLPFSASDPLE